jgi:uncharacterized protein (TIGR02594 family)
MPGVARANQDTAGGGLIITGSDDVIINGMPAARFNDTVEPHPALLHGPNTWDIVQGSGTVIVNGQQIARLGDLSSCGHEIEIASDDVIAGDEGDGSPIAAGANGPPPSSLFGNLPPGPPVEIDPAVQAAADEKTNGYVSNPSQYRVESDNQVKGNYAGTLDDGGSGTSQAPLSTAAASEIKPFLDALLKEAAIGSWRESGQEGNKSNPNIVGIWKDLGYPQKGAWTTDQTAWCMGFVNFVLKRTGYRWVQTARANDIRDAAAKFGAVRVEDINSAQPGDIVLWNYSHVNFVYTNTAGKLTFVGGNQSPRNKGNNPNDGDLTIGWPTGWTSGRGGITGIWRPTKS